MTPVDRPAFAQVMARLNLAYEKAASTVRAEMYFEDLKAAPIDLIETAAERWRRENNRFPRSADLRAMCDTVAAESHHAPTRLPSGPVDPAAEPTYCCLACEDQGWRWHVDGGPPYERASEAFAAKAAQRGSVFAVSPCPCRATNPIIRARYDAARSAPVYFGAKKEPSYARR